MTEYRIFETNSFCKDLRKTLSPVQQELILERLQSRIYVQLRQEPHYGVQIKKLKNYEPETWRYRLGDLRLFYAIDEEKKTVIVTALRFRKDAYR